MSQQFSVRLERAIGEYVRASVEFVLKAGTAEAVNTTGDALRALIYVEIDGARRDLLAALRECESTLDKAYRGEPVLVGPALTAARTAIKRGTGLE